MDQTPLKPRITVRGYLDGTSSYGFLVEQAIIGLARNGWDPSIFPYYISADASVPKEVSDRIIRREMPDPLDLVVYPPVGDKRFTRAPIYFTMWETPRLSADKVRILNQCKAVIVPSEFNVYSFSASGVTVPIYKVPLGINDKVFRFSPRNSDGKFVFNAAGRIHGIWDKKPTGTTFRALDDRKNLLMILKAFKRAFPDHKDAELRIKTSPHQWQHDVNDSRIRVIQEEFTEREVFEFYASSDCFVSASKMEGWGWMQQESMAVGRPVIAPITGGLREFMNERNAYAVDYGYENATEFFSGGGLWAKPSMESMVARMRQAYNNREELTQKGIEASCAASIFTHDLFGRNLAKVVEKVANESSAPANTNRRSPRKGRRRRVRRGRHENSAPESKPRLRFKSG